MRTEGEEGGCASRCRVEMWWWRESWGWSGRGNSCKCMVERAVAVMEGRLVISSSASSEGWECSEVYVVKLVTKSLRKFRL
jgi:hypothetical protein